MVIDPGDSDSSMSAPVRPSVETTCAEVVARVELDTTVEAVLDAMRDKVAGYGAMSDEALFEVRMAVLRTTDLFLRTLREMRCITDAEVDELEAFGERRSASGIYREDLEEAVTVAGIVRYDHLYGQVVATLGEGPGRPTETDAVSRHLSLHSQHFHGRHWAALRVGYERAEQEHHSNEQGQFLDALLDGEWMDEHAAQKAARRAASGLRAPCAVLALVPLDEGAGGLRDRVATLRSTMSDVFVTPSIIERCPHAIALVTVPNGGWEGLLISIEAAARTANLAVVAEPAARLVDVAGVYRGVQDRLVVVPRLAPRPRVLRAFDLSLPHAASVPDSDARFLDIDTVLGVELGRRRDHVEKSMQTLRALREFHGDADGAAASLGVTPKEVKRKLRNIRKRTGLDFTNPTDVARLGWALSLYWADPSTLPRPGDPRWGRAARAT